MDASFSVFESLSVSTYMRPLIYFILFYYFRKHLFKITWYKPIYIFLTFSFVLVVFSSEFFHSFKAYLQVFLSMMIGVIGFVYFDSREKIANLAKMLIICLAISSIMAFLGYAFGIGRVLEYTIFSDELEDESVGLLGSSGMYSASFIIGVTPFLLSYINKMRLKYFGIALAIITFIFILLNVRRTAILIPIAGLVVYAFYIPNKGKIMTGLFFSLILMLALSPIYTDKLMERFNFRQEQGRFDSDFYKTEGRFYETTIVYEEIMSFEDPILSLFGERIFASGWIDSEKQPRMLHSDPAVLIYGAGIIGFIIYILIYFKLFSLIPLGLTNNKFIGTLKGAFYTVIFISLMASLNGSILLMSLRSLIFLFLGLIYRQYLMYKVKINP
jgi:hypothetical protein